MTKLKSPAHPGHVLKMLYLEPLEMSSIALAKNLNVPRTRIERLVKSTTSITPDTALRLARFFKTTPMYWMNLQANFDLAKSKPDVAEIQPLEYA